MSVSKAFGVVLRHHRKTKGWSQEKLALEAGHERVFISWLENGRNQPSLSTVFSLALALGIAPSELVRDVEREVAKPDSADARTTRRTR